MKSLPVKFTRARPHLRVVRVVFHRQRLHPALRPVGQHDLNGVQYRHRPGRGVAQRLTHAVLEQRAVHGGVRLGDAHPGQEVRDGLRRVAAAAHGGQRGHPGIVPAGHLALLHEATQVALGHDGAGQVEPRELDLARRMGEPGLAHHPVVQRAVDLVLQRAQRVGHALQRVLQRVLEVVHRVDAPLVAGAVVVVAQDAVQRRVPHEYVRRGHVDLRTEDSRSVRELARLHPLEQVQVFLYGAPAVGAVHARLRQRTATNPHLLGRLVVHIGDALLDQRAGDIIELWEEVGREMQFVPLVAQPLDVLFDVVDEHRILLGGVGVVKPEVAGPAVLFRGAEIDAQRLRVADVQKPVGLGREPGFDVIVAARGQVLIDELLDKVGGAARFGHVRSPRFAKITIL